ncbi:hypothetical protein [Burkholderia vietnamiensis]|uniref:Uncharacterized protein n=1 Tax=Burkholderia vietnamiensis TaxID=60552 RepID=A0ABS1AP62_BURVI|nr:hypothetical protein [Burkholderia vietnamiensis]MBJ9685924.1 hypothetical protein [Burkholderia vietnamiensis]MBR8005089.1 hypothetical protein [Burkholderia vietnamiensis]MCA8070489.1 hypothetical protein [Burkholderia vietnamiensis]MCA8267596.1 hypothetical protein [Burkholderia vietnamiensis]MCA8288985.1 hypothetical protein [Burkholderia vietnamiensis]
MRDNAVVMANGSVGIGIGIGIGIGESNCERAGEALCGPARPPVMRRQLLAGQ